MRTSRPTEAAILTILERVEAGEEVGAGALLVACRTHGISEQTEYRWKATYGGLETNHRRRLRQREDENHRLKGIVARYPRSGWMTLDNTALKDALARK